MTREEAIANLNMISVAFVEPVTKEQRKLINDTFEMAISALEKIPKYRKKYKRWKRKALEHKPCEDVVSRKDVINAIDKWITEYKPQHYLIQSIRQLPSVTVRQCSLYSVSEDGRGLCALLEENPDDTPLTKERQNCEYRHENGNCLKVGGFCTAVDDKHCVKNERHTGKCKTCKHYLQGERDGSCDSYVCQHYSDWEGAE